MLGRINKYKPNIIKTLRFDDNFYSIFPDKINNDLKVPKYLQNYHKNACGLLLKLVFSLSLI